MLRLGASRLALLAALAMLVLVAACGPAATPTPTKAPSGTPTPTATRFVPVVQLPTNTPVPTAGATVAAPTATNTPVPAEKPKLGGTLAVGTTGSGAFDQLQTGAGYGWTSLGLIGNYVSQLIRISPVDRTTVEGDLAASWSVSGDGTEWKFKLRPGIIDHAGQPFTVDDALYQMIRYVERPNALPGNRQTCIGQYVKKIWDADKQVTKGGGAEVTGTDELTVRLKAPRGAFVPCFAGVWTVFAPSRFEKAIDSDASGKTRDLDFAKGEVIGTGPFKISDVKLDSYIKLTRFDKWYKAGQPYLDGFQINIIPDQSTLVAAFGTGQHELFIVTPTSIPLADANRYKASMKDVAFPYTAAIGYNNLNVNTTRAPFGPVGNERADKARMAMQLAMDRQEINDLVYEGIGTLATPYYIGWNWIFTEKEWVDQFSAYSSDTAVKAKNLATAQQLMTEAGYSATNRLKATITTAPTGESNNVSQLIAKQFAKIYMDIQVVGILDSRPVLLKNDYDLATDQVGAPFADPDSFNASVFLSFANGGRNYSGYQDPKWNELYQKELTVNTEKERGVLLREMAQIMYKNSTNIGHIRPQGIQAYRTYIKGWVPATYHSLGYSLENAWLNK